MGDAAHPVSSAGGQGPNMSITDARVLAEIAIKNPSQLLEEYELRRRKANERSLRFTPGAAWLLGLPAWALPISSVISVVRWVGQHPSVLAPIVRYAFQDHKRQGAPPEGTG
jgi:2-polyprenyl-6-methoxyphenol hydroxylase-like FAD-dependent oxidoreductase